VADGAARAEAAHRLVRPGGGVARVRTTFTAVGDEAGAVTVVSRTHRVPAADATDRTGARPDLATAFALAPLGMALVALDGRWLHVNAALCELLGYTEDELLATTFQELTHPDDLELDLRLLQETVDGRRAGYSMDKRYLHASGRVIHAGLLVAAVPGPDGLPLHFIAQVHDLTARHDLGESLRTLARADPLTGLLNRRSFGEELEHELERCARHGSRANMAVIDLDGFKAVNDTHGHAAGDGVLRDVAARLSERVRASDVVGRWAATSSSCCCAASGSRRPSWPHGASPRRSAAVPAPP
jgi:PAS domain S-box-containing protein